MMLASTLSRPRWAMPITISTIPCRAALTIARSKQRDQAFGAFQRKRLRADVFFADELLEDHGVGKPREDPQLLLARQADAVLGLFHPLLQPVTRPPGRRCA